MTTPPTAPAAADRLAPWLISTDTAAEIDFLETVFGAVESPGSRVMYGDRIAHVELALAGATVLMFDAADDWPSTPGHLRVYVKDIERVVTAAVAEGAVLFTPPTRMPFGDVAARVRDPQGHRWWIHEHVEDVGIEEMTRRFADPVTARTMASFGASLDAEIRTDAGSTRSSSS